MSRQNVEIARRAWEEWTRGDLDAFLEFFDPAVEWIPTRLWPEEDIYYGREGIRRFVEKWLASWERFESGVEEYLEVDGDRVLVLGWQRGFGPGSNVPVHMDFAQLTTMKDGLACRVEIYADRREALEAVGLSE
ncbi:MAG TPA: nuclear transport factor 2 family protein [Thermoleophilaceae bacterium]|jgi:ketosteroid isomerase-like protein|nr:nuclear transport factor 2 family protein [Thermoleophilaceae bacterium]